MRLETGDAELLLSDRELSVRVDFDDLDADGCVNASLRFVAGPRHPLAGDTVLMFDGVAGSCFGDVVAVLGWSARIAPRWDSWTPCADARTMRVRRTSPRPSPAGV